MLTGSLCWLRAYTALCQLAMVRWGLSAHRSPLKQTALPSSSPIWLQTKTKCLARFDQLASALVGVVTGRMSCFTMTSLQSSLPTTRPFNSVAQRPHTVPCFSGFSRPGRLPLRSESKLWRLALWSLVYAMSKSLPPRCLQAMHQAC